MSWPLQGLVASKKWGTTTRRLMALTLSSVAGDDGSGVYASVKTMARDSEISESTARRALQEFEAEGIIQKVGERKCTNGYTNVYTLSVSAIERLEDLKPIKAKAKEADRGVTVTGVSPRKGSHGDTRHLSPRHPTPVTVTDEPIREPIIEPLLLGGSPEPPPKTRAKAKGRGGYTAEFEAFWRMWPQTWRERSDKKLAFQRWRADLEQWPADLIVKAARRHIERAKKDAYRYCGRADVFLNGKLEAAVEAVTEIGGRECWDESLQTWVQQ